MKLGVLILLFHTTMAFPGISSAQTWLASSLHSIKNIIDNPLRRSTIPQFILDTRHPWILANQRKLERHSIAEAFLCSSPQSSDSKEVLIFRNGLEIPPDLFHGLEIDNNRHGTSRPGWPNALERLTEMKRCPRALEQVKTLSLDIYIHHDKYSPYHLRVLEPALPPEKLLTLFGDVLESMTSLETLKWGNREENAHFFEEAFTKRGLILPSVKKLEPAPYSQYLAGMCPNLESLTNGEGFSWYHGYVTERDWRLMLIQAAAENSMLKRFAMEEGNDGWSVAYVEEVVKSMPQIESLGLLGNIGSRPASDTDEGDDERLKAILDVLKELKNLKHLDLPDPSALGIGFIGHPIYGNVDSSIRERIYLRQVMSEWAKATEKGGDQVAAILPHLESFTIGGGRANITRSEDGSVKAIWIWTGRMKEWLMDMVPAQDEP